MKKFMSFLIVVTLLLGSICAIAETDYSGMTLDELLKAQEQLNAAIEAAQQSTESQETQEEQAPPLDTSNYTEMAKGAKGDEVKTLQTRLFELGFYSIAIDGDYGNGTVNAIKAFEDYNGFEQTGIATPELQAYMFSDKAQAKPVSVSSIKFASQKEAAAVGKTLNVAELVTIIPENATEKGLAFSVDNDELASIDANGILEAKARGNVTVTVTSKENVEKPKSATLKVKINQPIKTLTLEETEFNVGNGSTHQLEYNIGPDEADDKSVTWSSENPDIATVSKSGSVKGIDTGTTTITCTANDGSGLTASAKVTVITAVKKVAFDDKNVTLTVDDSKTLSVNVTPENATDPTVKWISSDTSIATVDSSGRLSAKKAGTCVITAEANDGTGASSEITLYVEPHLPVMVNSISWQLTWGQKNGKIGVEAENLCINKTIKSFDCKVVCHNAYNLNVSYDVFTYQGPTIKPGKTGESKMSKYGISGFTTAGTVEITPITVYFTDGTQVDIDEKYQYTSTFAL